MTGEFLELFTRYRGLFEKALLFGIVLLGLGYGAKFLLSLIGCWYLRYAKETRENEKDYDLGNGRIGIIQSRSLLHTTFILKDESLETRSNASLMEQFFKIGWKS
ncbi:MAG: hypothetical protein EHM45_20305 [Desulfobacteraceae bacterium]|nr:MAG: hypothetical protein EHM45_20305 [Desulfobacteraceae bacterium]